MKKKNTFIAFLSLPDVKHTCSFSGQYFNERPHRYNLFGLSRMLAEYGVNNGAISIPDKENDITQIQTPFIAQFSGDFVAVYKADVDNVSFFWKGARHVLSTARFIEAWTGIVLLAEASEQSGEPDYQKHRKSALIDLLKHTVFISACGLLVLITYLNHIFSYPGPQLFSYSITQLCL